jgi:hypothetical protein
VNGSAADPISRAEREELRRLVNERARLAKSGIDQRKAELLADAEARLAARYHFDDEAWTAVTEAAQRAVADAEQQIAAKCRELGIPEEFRPGLNLGWYKRGENGVRERRAELRKVAQSRVEVAARRAKVAIDTAALERREQLAAGALVSTAAREFLASMPTVAKLMPPLDVAELECGP